MSCVVLRKRDPLVLKEKEWLAWKPFQSYSFQATCIRIKESSHKPHLAEPPTDDSCDEAHQPACTVRTCVLL